MNSLSDNDSVSETVENLPGFSSPREALEEFGKDFQRLTTFVEALSSSREKLVREASAFRLRERKLSEEIAKLRTLGEKVDHQALLLSESERKLSAQQELSATTENELAAKIDALSQLKVEYREVLAEFSAATAELDNLKISFSDSERKREQFEESAEALRVELKTKKREIMDLDVRLLEQTSGLHEAQAKLLDTEEALQRMHEQMNAQAQELKEVRWKFLEHSEELNLLKGELSRKTLIIEAREQELDNRAEKIRNQLERLEDQESELHRLSSRLTEKEESLLKSSEATAAQAAVLSGLEKELAKVQQDLEHKHRLLRSAESKSRLDKDERQGLEEELGQLRTYATKTSDALISEQGRAEELRFKLGQELQKYQEAVKQRESIRAELGFTKDEIGQLRKQLLDSEDGNAKLNERLRLTQDELDTLTHEHRNVLRSEVEQSKELENTCNDLDRKSEALRVSQSQAADLREKYDVLKVKFDQNLLTLTEAQRKLGRLQDDLNAHKLQLQRAVRGTEAAAAADDLRRELEAKDLRLGQQEQLIRILQNRLGEKRVIPLNARDHSASAKQSEEELLSKADEPNVGNYK